MPQVISIMHNKMLTIILSSVLYTISFHITNCISQETDYFPLQIGNHWTYDFHYRDQNNNGEDYIYSITITDSTAGSFQFDNYPTPRADAVFRSDSNKVYRYSNGEFLLWYDFNAEVGDTLIIPGVNIVPTDTTDLICEVISKTDTFILGNDTLFNCIRFKFTIVKLYADFPQWKETFAPGVGLVLYDFSGFFPEGYYRLRGAGINGVMVDVQEHDKNAIDYPQSYLLFQNYPNPFNLSTNIRFRITTVRQYSNVELKIYDIQGRVVKTLFNRIQSLGDYDIVWDGRNDNGKEVADGVFFYVLLADGIIQSARKLVVLK